MPTTIGLKKSKRNRSYKNSRVREYQVHHKYEKNGYYAVRPAGSHGIADVVAIRPVHCGIPNHFEVIFEQIKTSQDFKEERQEIKVEECVFGPINVLWHYFPVKNEHWLQESRKRKEKAKKLKAGK